MLGPICSDWRPLTHAWCHQRCAEPTCADQRQQQNPPHREACDEVFAAENAACRPFWKYLERSNHVDRYEPGPREAMHERTRTPGRIAPAKMNAAKIGESMPVRTPDLRVRVETAYRVTRDLGAGRVMDVMA